MTPGRLAGFPSGLLSGARMAGNPNDETSASIRIGSWWVDPVANELHNATQVVRLEPKAMEVLAVLAKHQGQVVTRDQLLDEVWPGVIVGDAALTQVVIKLRKALGDDAQEPTFIETIPKRGYRLRIPADAEIPEPALVETGSSARGEEAPFIDAGNAEVRAVKSLLPGSRFKVALAFITFAVVMGLGVTKWVGTTSWAFSKLRPGGTEDFVGVTEKTLAQLAETLPTITVQHFEAASEDPIAGALAKGLGWEVADHLGHVSTLRVIASDGRNAASDEQSQARYLVNGIVQSGRGSVVVSVRLVDRKSGTDLWSEQFERTAHDVLGIQEEISKKLVTWLPVHVSEAEQKYMMLRDTHSMNAYNAFLLGHTAFLVRTPEDNAVARKMFLSAIEQDPQFARAYAGVALTHIEDYRLWRDEGREESLAEARRMAETAYQINPASKEAHWVLSYLSMHERNYARSIEQIKEALELDPSYADAYALLAWIHIFAGEPEKSVLMMRTAMRLNPGAGHIYFSHLGTAYYFLGDQEQALINLNEARARNPSDIQTRVWLAVSLLAAGRKEDAEWEAEEIHAIRPGFSGKSWLERMPMQDDKRRLQLAKAIKLLNL